jgi:hypothetical protein
MPAADYTEYGLETKPVFPEDDQVFWSFGVSTRFNVRSAPLFGRITE